VSCFFCSKAVLFFLFLPFFFKHGNKQLSLNLNLFFSLLGNKGSVVIVN